LLKKNLTFKVLFSTNDFLFRMINPYQIVNLTNEIVTLLTTKYTQLNI